MKKHAFSVALGMVCFISGYLISWSKQRAVEKPGPASKSVRLRADPKHSQDTLKNWNQGLIAPMNPPKVVAP
ncbi:MAG: hypothetical protein HZA92_18220 [Verrucomicrobia bacterium]|nr:hypothetical protein [Verrucomicrobiota bacterium]